MNNKETAGRSVARVGQAERGEAEQGHSDCREHEGHGLCLRPRAKPTRTGQRSGTKIRAEMFG